MSADLGTENRAHVAGLRSNRMETARGHSFRDTVAPGGELTFADTSAQCGSRIVGVVPRWSTVPFAIRLTPDAAWVTGWC